eukprot:NODE_29_length_37665_cov_1.081563.p29 type:complete len:119 gc:universal NODE_29_length_37665_cov_1.081563:27755-27399(-)
MIAFLLINLFGQPLEKRQAGLGGSQYSQCYYYYQLGYQYGFYDGYYYAMYYYRPNNRVGTGVGTGITNNFANPNTVTTPYNNGMYGSSIPGLQTSQTNGMPDFSNFQNYGAPPTPTPQ